MPIVTLRFKLPEEQEEFDLASKAGKYSSTLWSIDQEFFRANIKHGLQQETKHAIIEEVYDKDTQDKIAAWIRN
jgi:hypothetical protein